MLKQDINPKKQDFVIRPAKEATILKGKKGGGWGGGNSSSNILVHSAPATPNDQCPHFLSESELNAVKLYISINPWA